MSKYWVIFLALSLVVVPAMADDDPPALNPDAQTFMDRATSFVDDNEGQMPGFDRDQYLSELNAIAEQIPEDRDLGEFEIDRYMDNVESKTATMLNNMSGNADLKAEYLEEVANFFLKEYCKDMKNGVTGIDVDTYIDDLGRLNESYQGRVDALNSPPPSGNDLGFHPDDYLDMAAGTTKRSAQIEFSWGGIQNSWLNYNMIALVQAFQQRFSHDAVAQNDFQFLLDLWPQSAEAYMMNTAYNEGVYYISRPEDSGARERSYALDEYGEPTSEYEGTDEFDVSGTNRCITGTYNNRQWGYVNGTFDCVTITTNGRKYSLAESFYTSPIVLDLDNDGSIEASNGKWLPHDYQKGARLVDFDMNGDGFVDLCEWVGPEDGLLLIYDAKKGYVDGNDLFGNAGGFDHGYEELLLLDDNGDCMLTGKELAMLSVWTDLDSDAQVDSGEVQSLDAMGITLLSLNYDDDVVSYFVQNDEQKAMYDWFPAMFFVRKTE
jgi:hypothetical protein